MEVDKDPLIENPIDADVMALVEVPFNDCPATPPPSPALPHSLCCPQGSILPSINEKILFILR